MAEDRGWWTETGRWVKAPLLDVPEPRPRKEWPERTRERYRLERLIVVIIRIVLYVALALMNIDLPRLLPGG